MTKIYMSKSPFRISLAGGGTDIHSYSSQFGGEVVGISINKYVVSSIIKKQFGKTHINGPFSFSYENWEDVNDPFYKFALEYLNPEYKFNASICSDAPPQAGLGGSAAFLNSFLCSGLLAGGVDIKKNDIADKSSSIEIHKILRPVGKQDHYLSAIGGANYLKFDTQLNVETQPIKLREKCIDFFNHNLLLFYTNVQRSANEVLATKSEKIKNGNQSILDQLDGIRGLVQPMLNALKKDSPKEIGPIISEHWKIKSNFSKSKINGQINQIIQDGQHFGINGAKLLGAGDGGFILVCVKKGKGQLVRDFFKKLKFEELPFKIDTSGLVGYSFSI